MSATCRSCKAPIVWAVSAVDGKRIPIGEEPVAGGNVFLTGASHATGAPIVDFDRKSNEPNLFDGDAPRFVSHFATCPDASSWRQ